MKTNSGSRRAIAGAARTAMLLASTAASAAKETQILPPSSNWQLDYSPTSCKLARAFGEGDDKVVLLLTRYSPTPRMSMTLSGAMMNRLPGRGDVAIRFHDGAEPQDIMFFQGNLGETPALIAANGLYIRPEKDRDPSVESDEGLFDSAAEQADAQADLDEADKATYIWFDAPFHRPVKLETGALGKPYRAFNQCLKELVTHWGVDAERYAARTHNPKPINEPVRWITSKDYPSDMLRKGGQGIVHFRLTVGPDGKVADCNIQGGTEGDAFREVTCATIRKRATFEPARDSEGQPMTGYFLSTVRFEMPY